MNLLFFDTETTGFAKNGVQPRIIQIAWCVASLDGEVNLERSFLIKPDGWEVPAEKFWIENGHSTERCEEKGVPMSDVLEMLIGDIVGFNCETLVANNIDFDAPVLINEFQIYGLGTGRKMNRVCTMKSTSHLFGKWPKLQQLHQFLFGTRFEGAHDALDDIKATVKCFFELKKRGIITIGEAASHNVSS
jgi:DNA polymerase III epsilon subunit-like protein